MKELVLYDWCFRTMYRYPSRIKENNFCSRTCLAEARSRSRNPDGYRWYDTSGMSRNMSEINRRLNPTRMTPTVREKIRLSRLGSGEGKCYKKFYGRHEHRMVAEKLLGRPLRKGEVVHHLDGDHRNNKPGNLKVFRSQAEHACWHSGMKEVMKP